MSQDLSGTPEMRTPGELLASLALAPGGPLPQEVAARLRALTLSDEQLGDVLREIRTMVDRPTLRDRAEREGWLCWLETLSLAMRRLALPGSISVPWGERVRVALDAELGRADERLRQAGAWWAFGRMAETRRKALGKDVFPWSQIRAASEDRGFDWQAVAIEPMLQAWAEGLLAQADEHALKARVSEHGNVRECYRRRLARALSHLAVQPCDPVIFDEPWFVYPLPHMGPDAILTSHHEETGTRWTFPGRPPVFVDWGETSAELHGDEVTGPMRLRITIQQLDAARTACSVASRLDALVRSEFSSMDRLGRICRRAIDQMKDESWAGALREASACQKSGAEPSEGTRELVESAIRVRAASDVLAFRVSDPQLLAAVDDLDRAFAQHTEAAFVLDCERYADALAEVRAVDPDSWWGARWQFECQHWPLTEVLPGLRIESAAETPFDLAAQRPKRRAVRVVTEALPLAAGNSVARQETISLEPAMADARLEIFADSVTMHIVPRAGVRIVQVEAPGRVQAPPGPALAWTVTLVRKAQEPLPLRVVDDGGRCFDSDLIVEG
jgi:hypothetical protein